MTDAQKIMLSELGKKIRLLRTQLGISQVQLADSAGMSQRYLSEIEAGKHNVSITFLDALAKRLSISLPELVAGESKALKDDVLQQLFNILENLSLEDLLILLRFTQIFSKKS